MVGLFTLLNRFQLHSLAVRMTMMRHWRFGRWLCAGQLTDVSQDYCLHWLLLLLLGAVATGAYAACAIVVAVFNPVILGIGNVLLARVAQLNAVGGSREVRRVGSGVGTSASDRRERSPKPPPRTRSIAR